MSTKTNRILLDADAVTETVGQLARQVHAALPADAKVAIIGIRRRGEVLARRLVDLLHDFGVEGPLHGSLDITLYRDDLAELGPQAQLRRTEIDFDIDRLFVLLVDDVLFTGRSVRSALDALIDLGRPQAIRLAVLIDRPGRELPIQADFVGLRIKDDGNVTVSLTESDGIDEVRVG